MCLHIRNNQRRDKYHMPIPRIAKKEIICYKRLDTNTPYDLPNGIYITPFQGIHVRIGQNISANRLGIQAYSVHEGVHGYQTLQKAIQLVGYEQVIVECIIPVGAQYIRGEYQEIVATKMKLKRIIARFDGNKNLIVKKK